MTEPRSPSQSFFGSIRSTWLWLPQALAGAYLLLAAVVLASAPFLALNATGSAWAETGRLLFFTLPFFASLVYLLCAGWTLWLGRGSAVGRNLAVLLASVATAGGLFFNVATGRTSAWQWPLALAVAGGALFALGFLFAPDDPLLSRRPLRRLAGYGAAALLFLLTLPDHASKETWRVVYFFAGLGAMFCAARVLRWLSVASPIQADRARLLVYGALISFAPLGVWMLLAALWPVVPFSVALFLPLVVFPLLAGYTARRENLLRVNFVLSRMVLYSLLAGLVVAGYALLVAGFALVAARWVPSSSPTLLGLILFLLALIFTPARQALQKHLDAFFLRGERAYQERLQSFTGELTNLIDLQAITQTLRRHVAGALCPDRLHIYLYDAVLDQYGAAPDEHGQTSSDIHFAADGALVNLLQADPSAVYIHRLESLPPELLADEARLRLVAARVYVPLPGQQRMAGWLALGLRQSGEAYTSQEFNFLETLCAQAALAIERAQVAARMENRAREMTVLARLAQGINVTLSFDDVLELIYAQSGQILPIDDFQLLLLEPETGLLSAAFWIEQNERLVQKENISLAAGTSLEQEIIRQRRALLAEDYNAECQKRGFTPIHAGVFSWMGVPLNAGAETIGALVAASRNPDRIYSGEQLNLLQAVADQAAGAIIKTRLLHEAERRARQLSSLNDVTRQLTSTLELEPLLETILNSAVEILNCEAGSLIMVDEQIDEMVFRVVTGPVAQDLLGRHMPVGSGLAGKAVRSREAVLVNNVNETPEWFSKTDQQTGFMTRSVLVTPLVVKDRVIGVIEVINRRDGLPFGTDDEALQSAFASQAAVAIENARLYTMTDEALAVRVEELSVMQRIDRELNASLDTGRAMGATLEWAMRQSGAGAGLVGSVHEAGVQVMAAEGYGNELAAYPNQILPPSALDVREVIETGKPQCLLFAPTETGGVLTGTRAQTVLAIQGEGRVIGIVLLESTAPEQISEERLAFLNRLCDHASIAIANAQLYAQVQAANLAKSEFVSFVSHELKNPMTSVKGFTELLASGVVGPITESQASFLNTIRANIDRMNTLVSDLNDLSKIEVGRLRLDFKANPLGEAVEEVARSTRRQLEEKEQTLSLRLPEDLPPSWTDRTRLVQVLVNLVSNANKYTDKGGEVVLGAETCDNQWDKQGARRVLHIWVKDNGIGINEADQKKIFQKFFRSDDPKTREAPGTGLGLNITRSLVEMQGGRIWFESEFRQGTTFHFTVPIAEQ